MQNALYKTKFIFEESKSFKKRNINEWKDGFIEVLNNSTCREKTIDKKSVYCGLFNDGTIKVGVSKSPNERLKSISNSSGRAISEYFISEPIVNFLIIEKHTLRRFNKSRVNGEWLSSDADYNEVIDYIKGRI